MTMDLLRFTYMSYFLYHCQDFYRTWKLRSRNCLPWVHHCYLVGSVLLISLVFCVVLLCIFACCLPYCDVRYDFRIKRCSVRLYLQLFVGGLMSYLCYLCLFAYSGVQHILCCAVVLFVFVLCALCFQFLRIVHFWLPCPSSIL